MGFDASVEGVTYTAQELSDKATRMLKRTLYLTYLGWKIRLEKGNVYLVTMFIDPDGNEKSTEIKL